MMIRDAVLADIQAIVRLNGQELGYAYPEEKAREQLRLLLSDPSQKILVAECDGEVVGYIHAADYLALYAPMLKNIMGIAVSSRHRRKGIGKALLTAIADWAKETDAKGVRLVSGGTRTEAHAFYRACGYDGGKTQLNFKKYL